MEKKGNLKEAQDPGLGSSYNKSVPRIMNEDGTFNIERIGTVTGYKDVYKYLIDMSSMTFISFLVVTFLLLNCVFALFYLLIGVDDLNGITPDQNPFFAAFYFSAQTFTTVGYGAISPKGNLSSLVAALEAFVGLVAFAIATGLIYGRFSKPSAKIAFSHSILLAKHKDGLALMFKMVNLRNSVLLNTKVHVMVSMVRKNADSSAFLRNYYNLPLELDFVRFFPLTWTLVHPITEESPLYGMSLEEIHNHESEVLILVEAFDETFSQMVIQKHSYARHQWKDKKRFKRNFNSNEEGKIILNIHDLHELEDQE